MRTRVARQARGAALGLLADRLLGEPPTPAHPVAAFGRAMGKVEARIYSPARSRGVAYAAVGAGLGTAAGCVVRSTTVAVTVAAAGRALGDAATEVGDALVRDDLDEARRLLPGLVGRDPSQLDAAEISRAVVESVAENTVDAVVAPALWGALAGAPGALGHRAVNTMDAMVGYRSERYERFGWASARLDDVAAWAPARATAALVALVRPRSAAAVAAAVGRDAPQHPSPNAGVAEAAFAAALGIRLGGTSTYGERTELRPTLGRGRPAEAADIGRTVRLSGDVTAALGLVLLGTAELLDRVGTP